MKEQYTRQDFVKALEVLIQDEAMVFTHPRFRAGLTRDQNLYLNQMVREANGNVAYRSVDFELENLADDSFWTLIDTTDHSDFIEENAAAAILKMADRLNILN